MMAHRQYQLSKNVIDLLHVYTYGDVNSGPMLLIIILLFLVLERIGFFMMLVTHDRIWFDTMYGAVKPINCLVVKGN